MVYTYFVRVTFLTYPWTQTSTVGNQTYLADLDDSGTIRHIGSHLACFMAGNWIMGGRLLNNQTIVDIALELNEGCWNTYASTVYVPSAPTFCKTSSNIPNL